MANNILFKNNHCDSKLFNDNSHTLTFQNVKDEVYYIQFDNYETSKITINVINSTITLIESFVNSKNSYKFQYNILDSSTLNRFSMILDVTDRVSLDRNINNHGSYHSMQIDLTNKSVKSSETINLKTSQSSCEVIDGIYAVDKAKKSYQTLLNHFQSKTTSKVKIFAINNDFAQVKIDTDAYIKNGAIGSFATQEGRIINLSDTCSGIVLPNLHIDENDVQASHSCSVGSLNQEHLYYLESRGLDYESARNILIKGYFNPLLENIKSQTIQEELNIVLEQRIG